MSSYCKSRRYENDDINFIIPFLINHSYQKPKSVQSQRKRNSIPSYHKEVNTKDLQHISKIYNTKPKKKQIKLLNFSKSKIRSYDQPLSPIKKTQSAIVHYSPGKIVKQPYRFFKVHSQINHPPPQQFSPKHIQNSFKQTSPFRTQKTVSRQERRDDSPILGIKFKSKNNTDKNQTTSTQLIGVSSSNIQFQEFKGQAKKKLKYWKEKRDWEKMKGLNVDTIINRKCKNFNELMTEYRRRMDIEQGSMIFVFDSKDLWMKRVLIDRGWVQNNNITSRAFHLHWSNKLYKQSLFSQQFTNHYPNCYQLTTKTGLHNLLKKYALSHLQPKTFDLATQKNQFLQQFHKIEFICNIQKFLQKFQFQDPKIDLSLQDLLSQIRNLMNRAKEQKLNKSHVTWKIIQIVRYCEFFLNDKLKEYDSTVIYDVFNDINSQSILDNLEEQAIRVIRDFDIFVPISGVISNYHTIGSQNVWLTKSKISSKGVGISLHNDLESIMKHQNRLAQKYIEKPLIFQTTPFNGRKFDLRIWVLMIGSNPDVYYHERFYGRICYDNYSVTPHNLKNESVHLTNYSQNKQRFIKKSQLLQSIVLPEILFGLVYQTFGFDYRTKFYNDVQKIINKMLIIFQKQISNKQTDNNLQLFGFDLLLDSALHLHLLEVNLAARCEQRHPSLTDMLEMMGNGILNILQNRGVSDQRQLCGWKSLK